MSNGDKDDLRRQEKLAREMGVSMMGLEDRKRTDALVLALAEVLKEHADSGPNIVAAALTSLCGDNIAFGVFHLGADLTTMVDNFAKAIRFVAEKCISETMSAKGPDDRFN